MKVDDRNESVMGDGIRSYRPNALNLNQIANRLFAPSARTAFPDMESAIIVQQKKIPDVSFWQGEINWDLMREKTDTIIIRAGQNVWEDVQFKRNWTEAKKRGMKRGVYWFYDDRVSPGAQAEAWHILLGADPPELECITDWEKVFGGNFRGLANVVSMMERMEDFGYSSAMYTGYWWFRSNSNSIANASQYNYLKSRPLHLAWYTENASEVLIPFPWLEIWMWQCGTPAEGPDHGAKSEEIDMNFINMTTVQFYLRYGGANPLPDPEPIPDPIGDPMQGKVKTFTNIRNGPGTNYSDIGDLQANTIVTWDKSELVGGYQWYHLISATYNNNQVITLGGLYVSQRQDCWAYGPNIELITNPDPVPPYPTPLPAYFTAHDETGKELGRYIKQ